MIDTYKTAKIPSVTSRAVDIIKLCIISKALDVTEGIFAVLYVSIMGLTRFFIKRQFFLHLSPFIAPIRLHHSLSCKNDERA